MSNIGIGRALILNKKQNKIHNKIINNVEEETQRFYNSLNNIIAETEKQLQNLTDERKEIMEAYLIILNDPTLIQDTLSLIKEKHNAEYATEMGFNKIIDAFKYIEDKYISERAEDIEDIKQRILNNLLKIDNIDISNLHEKTIIISTEITTSDISKMDIKNIAGMISEVGGENSHVSIIARSKGIPFIIGEHLNVHNGDLVIIDKERKEVIVNPSEEVYREYQNMQNDETRKNQELEQYKHKEAVTLDGKKVEVLCNIGSPKDIDDVLECNADGIGLFRTEFLFMDSKSMPTEEEQFQAYKLVAEKMNGKPVIIRTLDIGGDKKLDYLDLPKEENPFLGYRAIRLCLDNLNLFKTQLRAILRASSFGNIRILLPMISGMEELLQAKNVIQDVKDELKGKHNFDENIKVGIMIEIPSAAIMADELAKECDFFSIGTNDLIQYTVAAERGNLKVSHLYKKENPAVVKLIKSAIESAHNNGIFCGMCGEAASDTSFVPLLLDFGLDEFSVNSSEVLKVKHCICDYRK